MWVLAIVPILVVHNEQVAPENWEISKFGGVGLQVIPRQNKFDYWQTVLISYNLILGFCKTLS